MENGVRRGPDAACQCILKAQRALPKCSTPINIDRVRN